jgi:hypothetical protein
MTTKTVPFNRNPLGAWAFGPQALSLVGCDGKPSRSPRFAPETRIPMRATPHTSTTNC